MYKRQTEGDTELRLKAVTPVRLLKSKFQEQVKEAEERGASPEELEQLLGKGRSKKGMKLGDLQEGELEIGQVSGYMDQILPAGEIVTSIWAEYLQSKIAL